MEQLVALVGSEREEIIWVLVTAFLSGMLGTWDLCPLPGNGHFRFYLRHYLKNILKQRNYIYRQ